jgi:hypothetical protein
LSWPRLAVAAGEPLKVGPWVSVTCRPSRALTSTAPVSSDPWQAPSLWSRLVGVAHDAASVDWAKASMLREARLCCHHATPSFHAAGGEIDATGVGHEPKPGSDVGRPDTASWQYGRPAGVPRASFQVSENNVEPTPSNRRLNLLSKDDCRTPLGDERKPARPQVAFVIARRALAGGAEGLAGAGTGPNRSVVGPSGEAQGDAPPADPGEEMALVISGEIVEPHVDDAALVNVAGSDMALSNEVSEPLRGIGVVLVVVGGHDANSGH